MTPSRRLKSGNAVIALDAYRPQIRREIIKQRVKKYYRSERCAIETETLLYVN